MSIINVLGINPYIATHLIVQMLLGLGLWGKGLIPLIGKNKYQ